MMNPFSIDHKTIKNLGPEELVNLLRRLLEKEALKAGISSENIIVSGDIYTNDGGIDAKIVGAPTGFEWLPGGSSGWQSKAENLGKTKARRTPYPKKGARNLSPGVIRLLEENGTYVLVCGKKDPPDTEAWARAIEEEFEKKGYPGGKARVYGAGQLASWAQKYPGIVIDIQPALQPCKSHHRWSLQSDIQTSPFIPDEIRKIEIEKIRDKLTNTSAQHIVRITGNSGVGKSRMVFEALNVKPLKDTVVYVPEAERASQALVTYLGESNLSKIILVVDDCDIDQHDKLVKSCSEYVKIVSLITLYPENDETDKSGQYQIRLKPLDNLASKALLDIIASKLPDEAKTKIVKMAEGYPQALSLIAENLGADPDIYSPDFLNKIGVSDMMERLIIGRRNRHSEQIRKTRRLLMELGLFVKLGWDDEVSSQGRIVCDRIGMTDSEAREIVAEEVNRGLVRKIGRYRSLTPQPLIIYLAAKWFKTYSCQDVKRLVDSLKNSSAILSFFERLSLLGQIEEASECAAQLLLDHNFWSSDFGILSEVGANIFYSLSQLNVNAAAACLEREINELDDKEISKSIEGRRTIVFALENLARWPLAFKKVFGVLLRLALNENEKGIANNATGVWLDFFYPILSGTPISLKDRLSLVKPIIDSNDDDQKLLLIEALGNVLKVDGYSRSASSNEQGALLVPDEWFPKIYNEIWLPQAKALEILVDLVASGSNEISEAAYNKIMENITGQLRTGNKLLAIDCLDSFLKLFKEPRQQLVEKVSFILKHANEALDKRDIIKLKKIRRVLNGTNFHTKLKRYVGMDPWIGDEEYGDWDDYQKILTEEVAKLAIQGARYKKKLFVEMSWLLLPTCKNSVLFGEMLAKADKEAKLLEPIWKATLNNPDATADLIAGYIFGLANKNERMADKFIEDVANTEKGKKHFIYIAWRFKPTKTVRALIIDGLKNKWLTADDLSLFAFGRWTEMLNEREFTKFVNEILSADENTATILVEIVHFYIHGKKRIGKTIVSFIEKLLSHEKALLNYKPTGHNIYFDWHKLALLLLDKKPDTAPMIVEQIISLAGEEFNYSTTDYLRVVLQKCLAINNREASLILLSKFMEENTTTYHLVYLIKGGVQFNDKEALIDLFELIPEDVLWDFCERYPEEGPYWIAKSLPLQGKNILHPIAEQLLIKYGDQNDVWNALTNNFANEGWSGPASAHYKKN